MAAAAVSSTIVSSSKTGLVYDRRCDLHQVDLSEKHVECPARTSHIWSGLASAGLTDRCTFVPSRLATDDEIGLVHDAKMIKGIKTAARQLALTNGAKKCKWWDEDTYFNRHSLESAQLSCGGLLALCDAVVTQKLDNGFAVIRPPGHHADVGCSQGFCIANNVAVAAAYLLKRYPSVIERILIVDWDVHHGNGTQNIFWDRTDVLYFSIHRYDGGQFYPKTGHPSAIGGPLAKGYNINMPLNGDNNGDPEYLLTWQRLLKPVATAFAPDVILVSSGFDCAAGDPLGELQVSTDAFAHLTHQLMQITPKVVIALEGGYNLSTITNATLSCVKALLKDPLPVLKQSDVKANQPCVNQIDQLIELHQPYWPSLQQQRSSDTSSSSLVNSIAKLTISDESKMATTSTAATVTETATAASTSEPDRLAALVESVDTALKQQGYEPFVPL